MTAIPIHDKHHVVVAHALVDEEDFAYLSQFAWCFGSKGYVIRSERMDGVNYTVRMHREVLGLARGDGAHADHIDRNKLDNRRSNLRVLTPGQNNENVPSRGGKSVFRGVSRTASGKWVAYARRNGYLNYLGVHAHEIDAARTAQAFRLKHMPHSTEVAL